MTARLYCFGESGNAYKAALTLELTGHPWQAVYVDFFNGETRTPAYREINVMGEVPVFVEGDITLSQSGVILTHIAAVTGKMGGASEAEKREVLRWILFDNHKVSGIAGPLRFNMNFLPEAKRNYDVNAYLSARMHSALKVMDAHLEGREWLAGNGPTIADTSACGYLFYPEPFTFDRVQYSNIDRWMDRLSGLSGWKNPYDLMPGSPADRT